MMRVREKSLELTQDSRLRAEDCKALDRLSSKVRKEYDTFISELININALSNKDLFLKVSSRNSLVSEVLQAFCNLAPTIRVCDIESLLRNTRLTISQRIKGLM